MCTVIGMRDNKISKIKTAVKKKQLSGQQPAQLEEIYWKTPWQLSFLLIAPFTQSTSEMAGPPTSNPQPIAWKWKLFSSLYPWSGMGRERDMEMLICLSYPLAPMRAVGTIQVFTSLAWLETDRSYGTTEGPQPRCLTVAIQHPVVFAEAFWYKHRY